MNRRAYNKSIEQHANNLFAYALRFLQNREDAEDIVQDVLEKLWIHRKKVDFEKVKSWMFTCAHNAMINYSNRRGRVYLSSEMQLYVREVEAASRFESQEVVDRAVNILPPIQKSVILLRDLEGYSYQDIGEILNLSESQVKVYLFRGRNKIKNQLKGLMELV